MSTSPATLHGRTSGAREPQFVTGDRVVTNTESWGDDIVHIGATGTVIRGGAFLSVFFDHDPVGDGTGVWAMASHQLEFLGHTASERTRLRETRGTAELVAYALHGHPIAPQP
jgi:hypothetical protein